MKILVHKYSKTIIAFAKREEDSHEYLRIVSISPCWRHVTKDYAQYYNNVCSKCPGKISLERNKDICFGYGNSFSVSFYDENYKRIDPKDIKVCYENTV